MESLTRLAASHGKTYKLGVPFSPRQPKEQENANIIKVDRRKSFTRTILVDSCARALRLTPPRRAVATQECARTAWHAHSVRCLIARTPAPLDLPSSYSAFEVEATHTWAASAWLASGTRHAWTAPGYWRLPWRGRRAHQRLSASRLRIGVTSGQTQPAPGRILP